AEGGNRVHADMGLQGLDDLGADGQYRVERGHGVLEHHRELGPAQATQRLGLERDEIAAGEHHPAGEARALGQQLQDGARQHGLAAARFAHDAQRVAGRQRQVDLVDGPERAARRGQLDGDALDRQHRSVHRAPGRGSVSARSVSPTILKASTLRNMKMAGRKASQGAMSRLSRPSAIMLPQLGAGGGTPNPRKESAPSTTMGTATPSRKKATTGRATLGKSSRSRMRLWVAPSARAATTNSRSVSESVTARATRVKAGTLSTPITSVMLATDWPM